jgi:hypothetical protein
VSKPYIDPKELRAHLGPWLKECKKAKKKNHPMPPMPEVVGEACIKIAHRLSMKMNFAAYTFRDEMISDALLGCCNYLHNFDMSRNTSPFAYITQVCHNAFIRRIQMEQKHSYIRAKLIVEKGISEEFDASNHVTVEHFEGLATKKRLKNKQRKDAAEMELLNTA